MSTVTQVAIAKVIANCQELQVMALQVYNDCTKLLGNAASLQTSINSTTGLYGAPDSIEIERTVANLKGQLTHIDNKVLVLQQSLVIPT